MRAGAHEVAVYADESDGVAEWREPVPLPHAPPAVLGVVNLRGRVRTVLDPATLLGAPAGGGEGTYRFIVVLGGNEQLALAVAHAEQAGAPGDLPTADPPAPFVRATFRRGDETVHLLDPAHLFAAAMQGTERRRQRQKP